MGEPGDLVEGAIGGAFAFAVSGELLAALECQDQRIKPNPGEKAGRRLLARLLRRRVERYAAAVLAAREFAPEEAAEVQGAVNLASNLVLFLLDGRVVDSQKAWSEFADRYGVDQAAEVVEDLVTDTEIVPMSLFALAAHTWATAAVHTKRIPEIMGGATAKKRIKAPKRRIDPRNLPHWP